MAIQNTNIQYINIKNDKLSNSTMLRMFDILKDDDDQYFMNIFKNFTIDSTIFDIPTNTESIGIVEPWWETISYKYYNDIDIWWLICLSNNILNPFEEINEGNILTILLPHYIPYIQRDMRRLFDL